MLEPEERDIRAKMFNGMMLSGCCEVLIFVIYVFLCYNKHNFKNISPVAGFCIFCLCVKVKMYYTFKIMENLE
jgi:hypothetical protein